MKFPGDNYQPITGNHDSHYLPLTKSGCLYQLLILVVSRGRKQTVFLLFVAVLWGI